MTKTELLLLVHNVKVKHDLKKRYVFDDLVKSTGRRVLRLPPYHPFFNAIEFVWADVKKYFRKHIGRNNDWSEAMMLKILDEAIASVTAEKWTKYVSHVEKLIYQRYKEEVSFAESLTDKEFRLRIDVDDNSDDSDDPDVEPESYLVRHARERYPNIQPSSPAVSTLKTKVRPSKRSLVKEFEKAKVSYACISMS